jgi:hypothetical protein
MCHSIVSIQQAADELDVNGEGSIFLCAANIRLEVNINYFLFFHLYYHAALFLPTLHLGNVFRYA